MRDCGLEGSTSSIYIWGRLLAVGCGMYMAEIRGIWCPTTNCTTNNIMMPFAMGAILPVGDWVTTPYYGRIGTTTVGRLILLALYPKNSG